MPVKLANLDFIERLPLEFVVGGAILYVMALITTPFKSFNAIASMSVTVIAAAFYLFQHRKGIASFAKHPSTYSLRKLARKQSLYSWAALAFFILALAIRVGPITNFILGSNQDISLHTLYTFSIVENAGIPDSVIPGYHLQTPVATHTILAYFSMLTGTPPEFITFHCLVFFGAAIVLAAYLFGAMLHSQELGLFTSLLMVNISVYPIGITWGSPWLVLGLLVFFVVSAVSISMFLENFKLSKSFLCIALFPGILTGFLASIYLPLYIILLVMVLLFIVLMRHSILRKIGGLAVIFASGIPMFTIWIYRYFFVAQPYSSYFFEKATSALNAQALQASATFLPLRNICSPSVLINTLNNWLTWSDKLGWPGAYIFLPLLVMGCFFLVYQLIRRRTRFFESSMPKYIVAIVGVVFLWGLNGPLGLFYIQDFGLGIMIGELDKIAAIIGTILLPFIITYLLTSLSCFLKRYSKLCVNISYHMVFLLLSVSIAIVPLSQAWLVGNYNVYATSTESDYALLKWMNAEIPSDADVLVNPFDPGQYVPSIGGQKAFGLASTGVVFLSEQYEVLHYNMYNQIFDSNTLAILRNVNVDYVFVGGYAFRQNWDPQYFIRNPLYFRIANKIGNSYLFAVKIPNWNMNTGFLNNSDYVGFSNNETLIDLKHMAMYNVATGEGMHLEIALKDNSNNILDFINPWNEPQEITVSQIGNQNTSMIFKIAGSAYSFNLALSSNEMKEIYLNLSVEHAPESSLIYFSYFPVYDVRQSNIQFFADTLGDWSLPSKSKVETISKGGATSFELVSTNQSVLGYNDHLLLRSSTIVDVTLKTRELNEQG
jgi:hypothetical protein